MAIHIIEEPSGAENVCGGTCGNPLPETNIWLAVVFDELHEIPEQIKSGYVNLVKCPTCQFEGNLWKGFLAIDLTRKRIVGVCHFVESEQLLKESLDHVWDLSLAKVPELKHMHWSEMALLEDFVHLNQLLTVSDEHFQAEVIDTRDYLERTKIQSLSERATACFHHLINRKLVLYVPKGIERNPQFSDLLHNIASEAMANSKIDSDKQELAKILVEFLDPRLSEDYLKHGIVKDQIVSEKSVDQDTSNWKELQSGRAPSELIQYISNLAGSFNSKPDHYAQHLAEYTHLLFLTREMKLNPFPPSLDANPVNFPELFSAAERLVSALPQDFIERPVSDPNGNKNSLAEYIHQTARIAHPNALALIHEITSRELFDNRENSQSLADASLNYFMLIARDLGSIDALICGTTQAGQYLEHVAGMPELSQTAYALGLNSFYQTQKKNNDVIAMFSKLTIGLAIAWESIASFASQLEQTKAAALAASMAKSLFMTQDRRDGAFSSGITWLNALIELGELTQEQLNDFADEFSEELEKAQENIDSLSDSEFTRLVNFYILTAIWQFRQDVKSTTFVCGVNELNESEESVVIDDEKLIIVDPGLLFTFGERNYSPSRLVPKPLIEEMQNVEGLAPDSVYLHDIDGKPIEKMPENALNICEYYLFHKTGHPPYVYLAQFIGVFWVYRLGLALDLAIKRNTDSFHLKIWSTLVDCLDSFPDSGILYYFTRCIELSSEVLKLDPKMTRICTLVGLLGRIRQYVSNDLDPTQSPHLTKSVENLKLEFDKDPTAFINQDTSVKSDPIADRLAEIFESMGYFYQAFELSVLRAKMTLEKKVLQYVAYYDFDKKTQEFRPFYRAARALKKVTEREKKHDIWRIELGELCKVLSQKLKLNSMDMTKEQNIEQALATLPTRVNDVASQIFTGGVVCHYTLLHETAQNDGCWQIGIFAPHGEIETFILDLPLERLYEAVKAVNDCLEVAREMVKGRSLSEVKDLLAEHQVELNPLLRELSTLVFPSALIKAITSGKIDRIYIIPEAYICDIPWNMLPILVDDREVPTGLFRHENNPLKISLLPNLHAFHQSNTRNSKLTAYKPKPLSVAMATNVPWNKSYARIHAVEKRILSLVNDLSSAHNIDGSAIVTENADVTSTLNNISKSHVFLFFGHGDILESGASLVMQDGLIGSQEIKGAHLNIGLLNKLTIIMACSGINSSPKHMGRELTGIHNALVNAGVTCVVGSVQPIYPVTAILTTEYILRQISSGVPIDQILAGARNQIARNDNMSHPIFWSDLITFGLGAIPLTLNEEK